MQNTVFAIVVLIVAGLVVWRMTPQEPEGGAIYATPVVDETGDPEENNPLVLYTAEQVALHSNAASCWSVINGNVYDLTAWISRHPGGSDKILAICGTDATAAFNLQHRSDGVPQQELENFNIGMLR